MRFYILILICVLLSLKVSSQGEINHGFKGGLNYNQLGDLTITGTIAGLNEKLKGDSKIGFHLGYYVQYELSKFYIRPELVFTSIKNSYKDMSSPAPEIGVSTLELPVLAGFKLIKPLSIYIGPSFIYTLDTEFAESFELNLDKKLSLGLNVGAAVKFSKLGLDLRYTRGLSENLASYFDDLPVDGAGYAIDTRPDMWVLSFSYQLN